MKVLIVSGGNSSERKISLISAKAVKKALEENGYHVQVFDLRHGFVALKKLAKDYHVIFPVIHGAEGEGVSLHKHLARINKPFVGGNWKNFQKGWHKISFKRFCEKENILTATWKLVKTKEQITKFGFPSVLKASAGGSSREIVILHSKKELNNQLINKLLKSGDKLFMERLLPGIEVTVGILDNQ